MVSIKVLPVTFLPQFAPLLAADLPPRPSSPPHSLTVPFCLRLEFKNKIRCSIAGRRLMKKGFEGCGLCRIGLRFLVQFGWVGEKSKYNILLFVCGTSVRVVKICNIFSGFLMWFINVIFLFFLVCMYVCMWKLSKNVMMNFVRFISFE